jgi:hypothetical protein
LRLARVDPSQFAAQKAGRDGLWDDVTENTAAVDIVGRKLHKSTLDLELTLPDIVDEGKRQYKQYAVGTMFKAVCKVRSKIMSSYRAAKTSRVPESTLRDYLKRPDCLTSPPISGRPTILTPGDEAKLEFYMLECEAAFCPLTKDVASTLVKRISEERNKVRVALGLKPRYFDTETGLPSEAWWRGFFKRKPRLAWRKPSRHSAAQIRAGNIPAVRAYVERVRERVRETGAKLLINIDELDLRQSQVKAKVIGRRGDQQVNALKPGGYSEHVTLVSAVRSDGEMLPPFFVFKGKTAPDAALADGALRGTGLGATGMQFSGLVNLVCRERMDDV